MRRLAACFLAAVATACASKPPAVARTAPTTAPAASAIQWQDWSDDIFVRATRENKLVLLDLGAVWCHWCHVMEETTYKDPLVIKLISEKYLPVRVDQDSRPDLSNRYEDYGWPATIVFDPKGGELAKRQGYLPPLRMSSMLQGFIDDPTPGPSVKAEAPPRAADAPGFTPEQREKLLARFNGAYDEKQSGWGSSQKFVDADVIEYCLTRGDATQKQRARDTLTAGLKLIDPAWGGVYQYSTDGDWVHPHFEKIMSYQADDIRAFSRAYVVLGDPAYLKAAQDLHRFLTNFLTAPTGAFYTSQDADLVAGEHSGEYFALDDAARRKKGVPRIDQHVYARENGWAIEALVSLYAATGDADTLKQATTAADWIVAHRLQPSGIYAHGEHDVAGPFLGDTLAMGRACLALYTATADRAWLDRAAAGANNLAAPFAGRDGGFATAVAKVGDPFSPRPELAENVSLARFANLLFAYTGDPRHRKLAEAAMKYVASPQMTERAGWAVGGLLLADAELASEPLHISIVGHKSDPVAKALYATALHDPRWYKRLDWVDSNESPLPNSTVEYPTLPEAAAFLCTNGACSAPVKDPQALTKLLAKR